MKNLNYILSAAGWIGLAITLAIVILFNKCNPQPQNTTTKETIINNYYDSASKIVTQKSIVPGPTIYVPVPADVDTQKILAAYFSKNPFVRIFESDTLRATLIDTISQNNFYSKGKFTYQWLKPVRTVESNTTTIIPEVKKRIQLLAGAHANFNQKYFSDWGPDVYLLTKRGNLFGAGYDVKQEVYSAKAAINLYEAFRNKNK